MARKSTPFHILFHYPPEWANAVLQARLEEAYLEHIRLTLVNSRLTVEQRHQVLDSLMAHFSDKRHSLKG